MSYFWYGLCLLSEINVRRSSHWRCTAFHCDVDDLVYGRVRYSFPSIVFRPELRTRGLLKLCIAIAFVAPTYSENDKLWYSNLVSRKKAVNF